MEKPETHIEANANKTDKILKMGTEAYYQAKEIDYKDGQTRALHSIVKKLYLYRRTKKALEKINEGLALTNEKISYKNTGFLFMFKASVLFQLGYSDEAKKQIIIMLRKL